MGWILSEELGKDVGWTMLHRHRRRQTALGGRTQIVLAGIGYPLGQIAPDSDGLHHVDDTLGKIVRRVITLPAAALIKLGVINETTLSEAEPSARYLVKAWSRLGRHEGSVANKRK